MDNNIEQLVLMSASVTGTPQNPTAIQHITFSQSIILVPLNQPFAHPPMTPNQPLPRPRPLQQLNFSQLVQSHVDPTLVPNPPVIPNSLNLTPTIQPDDGTQLGVSTQELPFAPEEATQEIERNARI